LSGGRKSFCEIGKEGFVGTRTFRGMEAVVYIDRK
jgi:hypothetical protein